MGKSRESETRDADELVAAGVAALKQGERSRAKQLLAQAVRADPDNVAGWLWLSGAVESPEERRFCLERVINLDPDNEAARRGLAAFFPARTVPPPPAGPPPPRPPEPSPPPAPALPVSEPPPAAADRPSPPDTPADSRTGTEPRRRKVRRRRRRIPAVALTLAGAAPLSQLGWMARYLPRLPVTESLRGEIRGEMLAMRGKPEYAFVLQSPNDPVKALSRLEALFVPADPESGRRKLIVRRERSGFSLQTPRAVLMVSIGFIGLSLLLFSFGAFNIWRGFQPGGQGTPGTGVGLVVTGVLLLMLSGLMLDMNARALWATGLVGASLVTTGTVGLLVDAQVWPLPAILLGTPLVVALLLLPGTRLVFGNPRHKGSLILNRAQALLLNGLPERAAEWFKLYLFIWRESAAMKDAVEGLARCRVLADLQGKVASRASQAENRL